jgi:hypothetical protein
VQSTAYPHLASSYNPARPLRLELPEDRSWYIPLDEVRFPSNCSAAQQLRYVIERADPLESTAQLLLGMRGSGRTTEFSRLRQLLESNREEPACVLWLDLRSWLDGSQPPGIIHVLRAMVSMVEDAAGGSRFRSYLLDLLKKHPEIGLLRLSEISLLHHRLKVDVSIRRALDTTIKNEADHFIQTAYQAIEEAVNSLRQRGWPGWFFW